MLLFWLGFVSDAHSQRRRKRKKIQLIS